MRVVDGIGLFAALILLMPALIVVALATGSWQLPGQTMAAAPNPLWSIVSQASFVEALRNTVFIAGAVAGLSVVVSMSLLALVSLGRLNPTGFGTWVAVLVPLSVNWMLRAIAMSATANDLANGLGLSGFVVLVLAELHLVLPPCLVATLIVARGLRPREFSIAANLGASAWLSLRRLVLKRLGAVIPLVFTLAFFIAAFDPIAPSVVGRGEYYTLAAFIIDRFRINDFGECAAAATVGVALAGASLLVAAVIGRGLGLRSGGSIRMTQPWSATVSVAFRELPLAVTLSYCIVITGLVVLIMPLITFLAATLGLIELPGAPGIEASRWILSERAQRAVFGSIAIAGLVVPITTALGMAAALSMHFSPRRRDVFVAAAIIAPSFLPPLLLGISMYAAQQPLGLDGTVPGVLLLQITFAGGIAFALGQTAVTTVSSRALRVVTNLTTQLSAVFRAIVLPLNRPIILVAVFVFLISWNEFVATWFVSGFLPMVSLYLYAQLGSSLNAQTFTLGVYTLVFALVAITVALRASSPKRARP